MPVRALPGRANKTATGPLPNVGRDGGKSIPAPVRGWNSRDALASMKETDAVRLDNWFPEETYISVRRGHEEHATGLGGDVDSLMSWNGPGDTKLFGAADGKIFETTSSGAVGSANVSSLSSNRWQHVMFGTSAGNFLYIVNGQDDPRYYDGSSWTTPSLSGSGLTVSSLININAFKRRLFFMESGSLAFWYLDADSVAGTLTSFDLGPLCRLGGFLMAMGTWTRDGGDGPDDYAVFITSKGEVLVFQGNDPGSASSWAHVGTFRIGSPIGRRCMMQFGADLVVITEDGFLPLSRVVATGRGSEQQAMSDRISRAVLEAVRDNRDRFSWQPIFHPAGNMILFNIPLANGEHHQYVANATTRAWCRFRDMDAHCWEVHDDRLFFGAAGGIVYEADTGESDDGDDIQADVIQAFSYFGDHGRMKKFNMLRPIITTDGGPDFSITVNVDFDESLIGATPAVGPISGADWDDAEWDEADWGQGLITTRNWYTIGAIGHAASAGISVMVQASSIRWIATDWLFEPAGFV